MNSEYMPEQKAPAVTFGGYVIPETVQEFQPPAPAEPVYFAPTPAPVSRMAQIQTIAAQVRAEFKWTPLTTGVAAFGFLLLGVLTGYLLSGGTDPATADMHPTEQHRTT